MFYWEMKTHPCILLFILSELSNLACEVSQTVSDKNSLFTVYNEYRESSQEFSPVDMHFECVEEHNPS